MQRRRLRAQPREQASRVVGNNRVDMRVGQLLPALRRVHRVGSHLHPGGGEDSGFAATSLATLVQMVGSGLGVSLLPAMAVEAGLANDAPVTVRPLEGGARREVAVAWRAGSSRGSEARLLADTLRGL